MIYGATGGIGRSLAERLHQQGTDLHLVGRDPLKLGSLAETLQASYTLGDVLDPDLLVWVNHDCGEQLSGLVYAVGTLQNRSLRCTPCNGLASLMRLPNWLHFYSVQTQLGSQAK